MSAVLSCCLVHSDCHHTAKPFTMEEIKNDWYNDSLWSERSNWASWNNSPWVFAGFPSAVAFINLKGVGAETGNASKWEHLWSLAPNVVSLFFAKTFNKLHVSKPLYCTLSQASNSKFSNGTTILNSSLHKYSSIAVWKRKWGVSSVKGNDLQQSTGFLMTENLLPISAYNAL